MRLMNRAGASLVVALLAVTLSSVPAFASSGSGHAVKTWAHKHGKLIDQIGSQINAFGGTLEAGEAECTALATSTGKAALLPLPPAASIKKGWQAGILGLMNGASDCEAAQNKSEIDEAISALERGAQSFQRAVNQMRKDGASLHFAKPRRPTTSTTLPAVAAAPTTTTTTILVTTTTHAPPPATTTTTTRAPTPPPTTAAPAACTPLTDGGNCYEPGEFCRDDDHGVTGRAGDGATITCEDNNGWRWEPT